MESTKHFLIEARHVKNFQNNDLFINAILILADVSKLYIGDKVLIKNNSNFELIKIDSNHILNSLLVQEIIGKFKYLKLKMT